MTNLFSSLGWLFWNAADLPYEAVTNQVDASISLLGTAEVAVLTNQKLAMLKEIWMDDTVILFL